MIEIDPEFLQDLEKQEAEIARYNKYVAVCESCGGTPWNYEKWVEFDKEYQNHLTHVPSPLSPEAFQRITQMNTTKPTLAELQVEVDRLKYECDNLTTERDRAIHFKKEAEKELNKLKHTYDQLLLECDKAAYTPIKQVTVPSNQPLYPHYYRTLPAATHVDIDWILHAWDIGHTVGHAVKKLLCAGQRGVKDKLQDLKEARNSINRAIELEETK
jgi:hypothetical protein